MVKVPWSFRLPPRSTLNCDVLGYHSASIGNFVPTFRYRWDPEECSSHGFVKFGLVKAVFHTGPQMHSACIFHISFSFFLDSIRNLLKLILRVWQLRESRPYFPFGRKRNAWLVITYELLKVQGFWVQFVLQHHGLHNFKSRLQLITIKLLDVWFHGTCLFYISRESP